jgi:hypothetical protein
MTGRVAIVAGEQRDVRAISQIAEKPQQPGRVLEYSSATSVFSARLIQRSSDIPPIVFNAYLRSRLSMFVELESDQQTFRIPRQIVSTPAHSISEEYEGRSSSVT